MMRLLTLRWGFLLESKGMDLEVLNAVQAEKGQYFYYPVNLELGWSVEEQGSTIEQL